MGTYHHDAVIVMLQPTPAKAPPSIDAFRSTMPSELADLVVGPVESAANFFLSYAFMPDGSKEGWDTSNEADEWRDRFVELFRGHYCDVLRVTFGGDLEGHIDARNEDFR